MLGQILLLIAHLSCGQYPARPIGGCSGSPYGGNYPNGIVEQLGTDNRRDTSSNPTRRFKIGFTDSVATRQDWFALAHVMPLGAPGPAGELKLSEEL